MAIDFDQNPGFSHTLLNVPFNALASLPYTFVGWINPPGGVGGADRFVLFLGRSSFIPPQNGYRLQIAASSGSNYKVRGVIQRSSFGPSIDSATSGDVASNQWVHVAVVFEGSGTSPTAIRVYVNGVQDGVNLSPAGGPDETLEYITIGGERPDSTTSQGYVGCAEYLAIYDRVLSDDEILELAGTKPPSEVQPNSRIFDAPLVTTASATANLVGPALTLFDDPPTGVITDCPTSSPVVPTPEPAPGSDGGVPYYIERMDNRIWPTIEDAWCLDSALSYPMPTPSASLVASSATGDRNITDYNIINGGSGYTAPLGQIADLTGAGDGALVSLGVSGGVIVTAAPISYGEDYAHPQLTILDTTGVGAVIQPIVTNYVTLSTNTSSFTSSDAGSIVRAGGGRMEIITVSTVTTAIANMIVPMTSVYPNDPYNTPLPVRSGDWTMTAPTTTVSGLDHLEGMTVAALADGGVVPDLVVEAGSVTLPVAATSIVVGLPFTVQLQTMYMDLGGGPTVQTRRKDVTQVVLRVESSRAPEIGLNQPDAATMPNQAEVPWGIRPYTALTQIVFRTPNMPAGQPAPLYSGDLEISNVFSAWDAKGQIAVQQTQPVPLGVVGLVSWVRVGDSTGQ